MKQPGGKVSLRQPRFSQSLKTYSIDTLSVLSKRGGRFRHLRADAMNEPCEYPDSIARLLREMPPAEVGHGTPVASARGVLASLDAGDLFGEQPLVDRTMAEACLCGLWLAYHFLDESHTISQSIHNHTGSFWHGIMHRREGDFSNAKYWFRNTGEHPAFAEISAAAAMEVEGKAAGAALPAEVSLWGSGGWDPFAFVDLCQLALRRQHSLLPICRTLTALEWRVLFDYCYARAVGV